MTPETKQAPPTTKARPGGVFDVTNEPWNAHTEEVEPWNSNPPNRVDVAPAKVVPLRLPVFL